MEEYKFNISLSILNHLGRNLYRNFITVIGEAISNAWDADAKNVHIQIDRDANQFFIKDDGDGMTEDDFKNKFLKIGYSKRIEFGSTTKSGRPFIGRKGIGKLALLSCAEKITVITKTISSPIIGGGIDNSLLDEAIKDDVSSNEYSLEHLDFDSLKIDDDFSKGTIIYFHNLHEGIKNRIEYIRKLIALNFRFSIIDPNFNIIVNGIPITIDELNDLSNNTQFIWEINSNADPIIDKIKTKGSSFKRLERLESSLNITGYISSVDKPSMLKIRGLDEKVSVDLFVNGRLREKDILKHIKSTRVVESYLYGQIHFNELDDDEDRFTSSREGVKADDPKFIEFISQIETILKHIFSQWDKWRIEINKEGDIENPSPTVTRKERKSKELYGAVAEDFLPLSTSSTRHQIEDWIDSLGQDAQFNIATYGECFVAENLLRMFIKEKNYTYSKSATEEIEKFKRAEADNKIAANLAIEIRKNNDDLSYASMTSLAYTADTNSTGQSIAFRQDAKRFKPIRDAMAHTSLLTNDAKSELTSTYNNIKARIKNLL